MPDAVSRWQLPADVVLSANWIASVQRYTGLDRPPNFLAHLLWQRGIHGLDALPGFLNPSRYQPASPFALGQDMRGAVERLVQARQNSEKVAIWGDFDADGVTATAVLWDGLGEFFPQGDRLCYFIPNRLTESHGLSPAGIDQLAAWGATLIVTCDTGSTNLSEIDYASRLGLDIIVTDHHTLAAERPPVVAIINPRSLPEDHPLATLSGVAVAYKLVEALYETLPKVPQRPLESLLDLVAVGLIADLVELKGDCRYLAQIGIEQLQTHTQSSPEAAARPGIAYLLELCKRSGDRPTDISFGIGPRINAVSRIHGDASFCVELLTSRDAARCQRLAYDTELANARRKALQKDLLAQVEQQLERVDLSTTQVLVLADPQWPVGVLGLVAGQVAQRYKRPTILLTEDLEADQETGVENGADSARLARGSARSHNRIDLYTLVQHQAHLLSSFGGHPFAAGLSLPVDNLPLFREAINRQLREQQGAAALENAATIYADITVTVADLGKALFRELKFLEPCGMGNPVPRLLLRNIWFKNAWNENIRDRAGGKLRYIKTEFELHDNSTPTGFPGLWWEHYREELPNSLCDAIVELDFNTYKKRYEVRLLEIRPSQFMDVSQAPVDWLVDQRQGLELPESTTEDAVAVPSQSSTELSPEPTDGLTLNHCPENWQDLQRWLSLANQQQRPLTLAYGSPSENPPADIFGMLMGLAKYLHRTGTTATRPQLQAKLSISDRSLALGLGALENLGFTLHRSEAGLEVLDVPKAIASPYPPTVYDFFNAVAEEQFRQRYFHQVPLKTLQAIAQQMQMAIQIDR
ncbi:MAG: single-stranded-DNA-specific exonuclease RecJ [Cyanobacteria bacterium J06639_16]